MHGADDHASGLDAFLHPVRAVVAFGRRVRLGIDIQGVVGAGLHARFAADATVGIEIDDAVRAQKQRRNRADLHAGRIGAVVAAVNGERTARIGERSLLHVLDPGAVDPQGDVVFRLAGHRAGVTADAAAIVDDKSVIHREKEKRFELIRSLGSGCPVRAIVKAPATASG